MMVEVVEGIIINVKSYSETSKIVDIFTKEYGIIRVLAKGAKTLKSKLRSVTDKLTYGKFTIYYKKDKLSILNEASIIDNLSNIKKSIEKIGYVSYILDLSTQVYKQNNTYDIYNLMISAILKINSNLNPLIITNILELKYLNYLGIGLNLGGCSVCGKKQVITLSSEKGGYLCNKCRKEEPLVDNKIIKLIRMYSLVDISKISKLDLNNEIVLFINNFIDEYYDRYSGLYLKSKTFLQKLNNITKN